MKTFPPTDFDDFSVEDNPMDDHMAPDLPNPSLNQTQSQAPSRAQDGPSSTQEPGGSGLQSTASERLVLAAGLREDRADLAREIFSMLGADDFFEEPHRNLWQCRQNLEDAGVSAHPAAVMDMARRLGVFIGDATYVVDLLRDDILSAASDASVREAAFRIKELSVRRGLIASLQSTLEMAQSGMGRVDELLTAVSDAADAARTATQAKTSGPVHASHYISAVTEQVEKRLEGIQPDNLVPTGFTGLDNIIQGVSEGDLVILAARPSMGKTAMSLALATKMAEMYRRDVLYFSTEQSGQQLAWRMLANQSGIHSTHMKQAEFADGEFTRFADACSQVGNLPIWIDETAELTLPQLRLRARTFAQQHERPLIVVDYLQRLTPHRQADPRLIIGEISTALKTLARDLRAPVIALAQLNRELEKRASKRPIMSDLAESGKIEQDADLILFLYRDEIYSPDTKEPGVTEVIVGKNRDGAIGTAKLRFEAAIQRFSDFYAGFG